MKIQTRTLELCGTNYEIGAALGKATASFEPLKMLHTSGRNGLTPEETERAAALFDRWCPGLVEELQGFADELNVPLSQIFYLGMTYLRPNCSQIALSPAMTRSKRPLLARNYEFSHEAEDFTLVKTSVTGKYTHMGTSVLHFGRDDGFNECGLAVSMSSCGFPVGNQQNMRKPKIIGLQFWAVIRTVLENCRDVDEALAYLQGMPVAYNMNLMLADKSGSIALAETMDGQWAVKRMAQERYLAATNHIVLPQLIHLEPKAMQHSIERYDWIQNQLAQAEDMEPDDLKEMLLAKYPKGLCCHFYKDFFGTTKSMIMDPACGTIELCWGGRQENGWQKYNINKPLPYTEQRIEINIERFDPSLARYLPLKQ